jgi:transcriptional regulator with XRE-family HTH domain
LSATDNDGIDMARRKRTRAEIAGAREARAIAATLGGESRRTRRARRMTQKELGRRVGLSQSQISHLEAGNGEGTSLATWTAIGIALDRPIAIAFSRDSTAAMPRDAGHLAGQELVLRLAAKNGWTGQFEVPTRPANPALSVDVCLRDPAHRVLFVIEIWNRLDDLGRAVRSMSRKAAEAGDLAVSRPSPARVATCWLLVDSKANRELVRRYPAVIRATFTASSAAWVRALEGEGPAPDQPGIAWIDVRRGRLTELRLARDQPR